MSEQKDLRKLVEKAQKGDISAFGRIYDLLYDRIYAYVLHRVGVRAQAEDIAAEVFVDALEGLDGFRWQGAGFRAWIYRIAHNDVLDHFRRTGRTVGEVPLDEDAREVPAEKQVEDVVAGKWEQRALLRAVRSLSDDQQQVVLLKLVGNLSNRQIGEVISKNEGAVKALQHRALARLRKLLEESRESPPGGAG